MSNTSKMDTSAVFEMFEAINNKLDKRTEKLVKSMQVDLSAVNTFFNIIINSPHECEK
jgi:hypothetical protein